MVIRHGDRVVLGDEVTVDDLVGVAAKHVRGIGTGTIRRIAIPVFGEEAERCSAEGKAPAAVNVDRPPIARKARSVAVARECCGVNTSTGTASSSAAVWIAREPTTIGARVAATLRSVKLCSMVCPSATVS